MTDHQTQFIGQHPNGQSEWFCPLCGYHIIIGENSVTWLDYGDPQASHHGATGGLSVTASADDLPGLDDFKSQGWGPRL